MSDPQPPQNPAPPVTEAQLIVTPVPGPIGLPPEPVASEPANLEKPLEVPPVAPEAPPSSVPPTPADTPIEDTQGKLVSAPAPVEPPGEPLPRVSPIVVLPQAHPRSFLTKALESIQFRIWTHTECGEYMCVYNISYRTTFYFSTPFLGGRGGRKRERDRQVVAQWRVRGGYFARL